MKILANGDVTLSQGELASFWLFAHTEEAYPWNTFDVEEALEAVTRFLRKAEG